MLNKTRRVTMLVNVDKSGSVGMTSCKCEQLIMIEGRRERKDEANDCKCR